MSLDALRGRGAYRCGCGARIVVNVPQPERSERCAWRDCRLVALRDYDVPVCADHLRRLKVQLAIHRDVEYQNELLRRSMYDGEIEFEDDLEEAVAKRRTQKAEVRLASDPSYAPWKADPSWCYFMRHETNIKIGYSRDPRKRALALAGAEILAKEPGAKQREAELHLKFAHLRLHGEWFEPGPDLLAYITDLRRQLGIGPIPETSRQAHAKKLLARKRAATKAKKRPASGDAEVKD